MKNNEVNKNRSAIITGSIIIMLGLVWLLRRMEVPIPYWITSWEALLIAVGVLLGIGNRFRNPASYILIGIGVIFIFDDILPYYWQDYLWPAVVILVGLFIILKPRLQKRQREKVLAESSGSDTGGERLSITSIFNGVKRTLRNPDFRGGTIVNIFGGSEVNLMQSNIQGTAYLDVTAIFGGVKLIVPPTWEVRLEETSLFGGVEDKRYGALDVVPEDKVLVITGTVIFGGMDIHS